MLAIGAGNIEPKTPSTYAGSTTSNDFHVILSIEVHQFTADIDFFIIRLLLIVRTYYIKLNCTVMMPLSQL